MAEETVVYRARRIVTMDRSNPEATHVAVREGRILAVGGEAETSVWGPVRRDERFRDLVLLPGFIEGHSHAATGICAGTRNTRRECMARLCPCDTLIFLKDADRARRRSTPTMLRTAGRSGSAA